MRPAVEADLDLAFSQCDVRRHVDQIAENLAGLGVGIAARSFGEETLETAGDDQQDHIEVDLEPDG